MAGGEKHADKHPRERKGMQCSGNGWGGFSLTLVLVAFFLIEGVASIMFALDHRKETSGQWGWMLASGIIDLALAIMIFAGLPPHSTRAIGFGRVGRRPEPRA